MKTKGVLHDSSQAVRLLDMMTDTLLLITNDGICTDMIVKTENNPYVNEERTLIGRNIFEYFPEETVKELKPAIEQVIRTGEVSNANYDLPGPEKMYYFKCIIQKYDEEHVLFQYRDITQRSQMKKRLEIANERLRETERAAKIGYWIYNATTKILRYKGFVGISLNIDEEVVMHLDEYLKYVYHEDREVLENFLSNPNNKQESYDYRVVGEKIYFMRSKLVNNYYERNGDLIFEGYTQNIDDIIYGWDKLKMITSAVNRINESIFSARMDGSLIFANQLCRQMNHLPDDGDMHDYKAYEVFGNFRGLKKWNKFIDALRANNDSFSFICNHPYPEFNVVSSECSAFIIRNDYGEEVIWHLRRDISEQVGYEEKLKKAKEKAEESDRLKSAFLSNMSHEIRTPLNAIVGFSAIMADIEDREERLKFLNIIESNNKRLLMLIDEVLDLSKIESGMLPFNFSSVRMNDLCMDIFRTYQYYTGKATLILDLPEEDLCIRTDRNRLTQVISNLIDNALKFTPQGTITIGYRTLPEWVELFVIDTGIGIPEDKLEKVFERFVKVNNFAKGTGLGLPICKTIVERLGGEITLTSRLGSGSQFTFKIPKQLVSMDDDHFRIQSVSSSPVRNKSEGKATILVVEDIDDNFELIQTMIGPGYYLIHARDGKQAVSLFESEQPDLILMDIKLPEVNGLEAIETIREKSPFYPPIIAVSAYAYDRNKQMLLENGCKDFLIKPLDKELLLATIKKYL